MDRLHQITLHLVVQNQVFPQGSKQSMSPFPILYIPVPFKNHLLFFLFDLVLSLYYSDTPANEPVNESANEPALYDDNAEIVYDETQEEFNETGEYYDEAEQYDENGQNCEEGENYESQDTTARVAPARPPPATPPTRPPPALPA